MHYLWNYDSAAKEIIRIAKYTPSNAILTLLADRLGSHLCSREAKRDWDLVIPVPSSTQSLWKRGFNQCEILSKNIARRLNLPHETRALSHLGARSPQAALGGKARIRNASHAFQAHSPYIAGKSILLIEDVVTTGATVAAITRQLLDAGAVFVDVAALARVSSWNTFRHEIAARI